MTDWIARRGTAVRRTRHKFERYEVVELAALCGRLRDGVPVCDGALGFIRDGFARETSPGEYLNDRLGVVVEPGVVRGADGIYDYNSNAKRRLAKGQRPELDALPGHPEVHGVEVFSEVALPARRRCPKCQATGVLTAVLLTE